MSSTKRITYSRQNVIDILEAIKKHRCLWAQGTNKHKNKIAREAAYLEIVNDLSIPGLSTQMLQRKFENLKLNYYLERRQALRARKNGAIYKPTVFWYETADSFLREKFKEKALQEKIYTTTARTFLNVKMRGKCYLGAKYKPPAKQSNDIPYTPVGPHEDEFDVFGRSVAMQLKSLPLCQALELQQRLQTVITQHRIAFYTKEAVATMPSSSTNEPCSSLQADVSDAENSSEIKVEDIDYILRTHGVTMECDIKEEDAILDPMNRLN